MLTEPKGIKAAITAGVSSIEHGSLLDDEGIRMMKNTMSFWFQRPV